jgi:hypothetical protein
MSTTKDIEAALGGLLGEADEQYQAAPFPTWFLEPVTDKTYTSEQVKRMADEIAVEYQRLGVVQGLSKALQAVRRLA